MNENQQFLIVEMMVDVEWQWITMIAKSPIEYFDLFIMANLTLRLDELDIENKARDIAIAELQKSLEFAYKEIRERKSEYDHLHILGGDVKLKFWLGILRKLIEMCQTIPNDRIS